MYCTDLGTTCVLFWCRSYNVIGAAIICQLHSVSTLVSYRMLLNLSSGVIRNDRCALVYCTTLLMLCPVFCRMLQLKYIPVMRCALGCPALLSYYWTIETVQHPALGRSKHTALHDDPTINVFSRHSLRRWLVSLLTGTELSSFQLLPWPTVVLPCRMDHRRRRLRRLPRPLHQCWIVQVWHFCWDLPDKAIIS